MNSIKQNKRGAMLIIVLVATGLFLIITMGAIELAILQQKLNIQKVAKAQALYIAEAGVNYYRWVLYHDHEEYCNKEACLSGPEYGPYGPYSYNDSGGNGISGSYELYITPPPANGSSIVNIRSIGYVNTFPNTTASVEVQCGIPSWSSYSTLANAAMRFGSGTEIWGPIHSNGGIRFDGLAHNIITSSMLDYDDPDHSGANEFGVHTHISPIDPLPDGFNPPQNVPDRQDVFMAGRSFPEPVISFDLLNNYINETYAKATSAGMIIDPGAGSEPWSDCNLDWCNKGFHITINTNNTFDIKGVSSVRSSCSGNPSNSINNESAWSGNYPIPANGIIFIKNTIWIDGQLDNDMRVTILAFEDPFASGNADININNDIAYSNHDGSQALGLIAQQDINVGQYSNDFLIIDAALIAKEGRIGREYYGFACANSVRNTITVTGTIATRNRYGFAWTDGTGYQIRNLIYDNNLTFAPPPHFPTTGEYTFISWKEN